MGLWGIYRFSEVSIVIGYIWIVISWVMTLVKCTHLSWRLSMLQIIAYGVTLLVDALIIQAIIFWAQYSMSKKSGGD